MRDVYFNISTFPDFETAKPGYITMFKTYFHISKFPHLTVSLSPLTARTNSNKCDNRFLAWESTSVKTWGSLRLRGSVPDLLQGIIFRDVDSTQSLGPTVELNPGCNPRI